MKDRWSQLSLKDKSDLMSLYIKNGISSLEEIKKHYNSFADGGELNESVSEINDNPPNKHWYDNYYSWRRKVGKHKDLDIKNDDTYNYRKYYRENQNEAWSMLDEDSNAHFPDTYKYPNHPTFSNQSMYSQQWQQDHNVKNWINAPMGGDWGTDEQGKPVFYHSYYTASTPEKIQRTAEYLRQNDPGVKAVFEPITNNIILPQVDVTSNPELTQQQVKMINGGMYMPKAIQDKINEANQHYRNLANINNQAFPNLRQETYNAFNSQIWDLENQAKVGYDKATDRWVAHKSPEGGAETIGGGIKLGKTNPKWDKIYKKQGYLTTAQVEEAMKENADRAYNAAKSAYIKAYGDKEWEQLNPTLRALLMDISYNTGNVSGFKGLLKAIHEKDIEEIKKQHHRTYKYKGKTFPVKNRNNYFDSIIENTPNLFSLGGF